MLRSLMAVGIGIAVIACGPSFLGYQRTIVTNHHPTICTGSTGSDTTIYDTTRVTEKPVLHEYLTVYYPRWEQANQVEGSVVLSAVVNTDGRIDSTTVTVLRHDRASFEAAARQSLYSAFYWPGCNAQVPARVRIAVPFTWSIKTP